MAAERPPSLQLAPGAPAWLQAARLQAGLQAGLQAASLRLAGAGAPADIVLHTAGLPQDAAEADHANANATVHWALCDGQGRLLHASQPLLADITAGRGIALACWQFSPASGRWHPLRTLHVAASARYAHGVAGLPEAAERLLALALTALRLDTPLQPTSLAALAAAPAQPTFIAALRHRAAGRARAAVRRLRALWLSESWRIGLIDAPVAQLLQAGPLPPVRWLTQASANGYWADPFGLPDDPARLACEYFDRASGIGHIECLTLDMHGATAQRRALPVGGDGHASFPFVCRIDGQLLGVAETLGTRSVVLHAVDADGSWRPLWPLLHGVAAADPALFVHQGRYWLAYTDAALGAQDNLCLHHADSLRGPWLPHAANPVKVDVTGARMAGSPFWHDGALHRPAQDCLRAYGAAVVLQRIDTLTPTAFAETTVRRLSPDAAGPCPDGLHTVSAWGQRTLVDGKHLRLEPAALLMKLRKPRVRQAQGALDGAPGGVFVYVPHLRTGGGELSMLALAAGFADAGRQVTLVVHTAHTQELALPPGVQLLSLGRDGTAGALWRLVRALRQHRPQWLLSAFPHSNVAAVVATLLARQGKDSGTRCVLTEHAPVSLQIAQHGGWRWRVLPPLLRWAYPRAAAVVAVSDGVRDDLLGLVPRLSPRLSPHLSPAVIRNPVLPPTWQADLAQEPDHAWLRDRSLQVVLSVGRLSAEKDLATLLRAFHTLHPSRPTTRLLLAGEGPERPRLQALVAELGLQHVVQLPGRTAQPLRWMQRAAVLVLASRFEGFGNVLVEALACGTPVVATDCPVGPREILQGGRFGALVPVGDAAAMAGAIGEALAQPRTLPPGARDMALQHTQERAAAAYLALFDSLAGGGAAATAAQPGASAC